MARLLVVSFLLFALSSCEGNSATNNPLDAANQAAAGANTDSKPPAETIKTPAAPATGGDAVKSTADSALGSAKNAAAGSAEAIAIPASATELQKNIGTLKVDQLKALADKIAGELT